MTWWAIDVRTAPDRREQVGAWLVARTGQAVEEREDGTLVTFAPDEAAADALVAELAARRRVHRETTPPPLETVDWSVRWREGSGPRHFGRLTVVPSWVAGADPMIDCTVVLDPETAFGSGEHGSTRAALTLLERHLRPGQRVLDLGSGSGILAIAAVRLGAAIAIGIENDADSNPVARRNADRNGVSRSRRHLSTATPPISLRCSGRPISCSPTSFAPSTPPCCRPSSPRWPRWPRDLFGHGGDGGGRVSACAGHGGFGGRDEAVDEGWWAVAAGHS